MVYYPDQAYSALSQQCDDRSMIPPSASLWSAYQQQQNRPWHLFRLPLELRQQIYSHLLEDDIKYSPLPSVGINSVRPTPPSDNLLMAHPTMTQDVLDYFYSIATFTIVCTHSYNLFRIDPEYQHLAQCSILPYVRRLEIEFYSNRAILKEYPSVGVQGLYAQMENRAARLCQALTKAKDLRTVIVSLKDKTNGETYDRKSDILRPLRLLCENGHPDLRFEIGDVVAAESVDEQEFAAALGRIVGDKLRVHTHNHSLACIYCKRHHTPRWRCQELMGPR